MNKLTTNDINILLSEHRRAVAVQQTKGGVIYLEHEDGLHIKAQTPGGVIGGWYQPYEEKPTFQRVGRFLVLRKSDRSFCFSSEKQKWGDPFSIGANHTFRVFCDHLCVMDDKTNEIAVFVENVGISQWFIAFVPEDPFELINGTLHLKSGKGTFKALEADLKWSLVWQIVENSNDQN